MAGRTLILALLLTAAARAGEGAAWRYLPVGAYAEEPLHLEVERGAGWRASTDDGGTPGATTVDEALRLVVAIGAARRVTATAPDGGALHVHLVRPGEGGALVQHADRLTLGGSPAILVLGRVDARADRRWALLRRFSTDDPTPCAHRLEGAGLLALAAASQALDLRGGGLLVRLSGDDRLLGWKHREYRQALAWLVADALARGAAPIVLVEPAAPKADEELIRPLVQAVRDVGIAYQCHVVDSGALADHRWWEVAPGVLGERLNAGGAERAMALVAPWVAPAP